MFPLTTIVKYPNGDHELIHGSLYRVPPELIDPPRLRELLRIERSGWHVTEFGYFAYSKRGLDRSIYIFPGLQIERESKVRRRIYGYGQTFSKTQIEAMAVGVTDVEERFRSKAESEFNLLVHDLRGLSNSIYHAAEEARNLLQVNDMSGVGVRIENIIAAQTMLKIRTDILDYSGYVDLADTAMNVPIYRRVDKVVRSFSPFANRSGTSIRLTGSSYRESYGPNVFEIISYLLIDNAVKYSPRHESVLVTVEEDEETITVKVNSTGPQIFEDEMEAIFVDGFRGRNAMKLGKPGNGMGLELAKRLVMQFDGEILASSEQVPEFRIDRVQMAQVCFTVRVLVFVARRMAL